MQILRVGQPWRILSLWQPWASLWVAGEKMLETRSWPTEYRGTVAVHAAKHFTAEEETVARNEPFKSALERIGFVEPRDLPRGAIVGRVDLVDCRPMSGHARSLIGEHLCICGDCLQQPERSFGRYELDRFAWVTGADRRVLAEPIPFRGGQGLRNLPTEIEARLR